MLDQVLVPFFDSIGGTLYGMLLTHWPLVLLIGVISILSRVFRLASVKGMVGETIVDRMVLNRLDKSSYSVFNDLYLPRPDGKGTTQIDHVVTSPFGIFVIETKNMKGWIFGDEKSRWWTQSIYGKKSRFQNPLHQNALHCNALSKLLGLPREHFHNLVFFVGDAELKTKLPSHVATKGFRSLIVLRKDRCLPDETVERVSETLGSLRANTNKRQAKRDHLDQLLVRS